jgi:hypothetical protein
MVEDTTTLAEEQKQWSKTRKCWQRSKVDGQHPGYEGLCFKIIGGTIQTMVFAI